MTARKPTAPPKGSKGAKKAEPKKTRPDWEAIERDYRTGYFTLRELAAKHGVTHTTISRRADRLEWTKDLSTAIRQATNAKVIEATLQQQRTTSHQDATNAVLGAAELNKQVILGQRSRVTAAVDVSMRMLAELDATTTKAEEIERMFEVLADGMDQQQLDSARRQLSEFLRLHNRVGSVQKLMEALNKAQAMERQAFSLDDAGKKPEEPPSAANIEPGREVDAYVAWVNG